MASPKQPRGWGQNIKDFKMKVNSHGYKQTHQQSKGPSQRIKPARRKISKELDNFHGFAEISDDQAIPTGSTNQDFLEDSDTVIFEDDEDIRDFNERANPDWNGDKFEGINLTLTEDVVEKYTMFFAEVGDAPTLGAYPIGIQKQILNHDRHYEKIVHRIFDMAFQYTHKSLEKSPSTMPFWKWLEANQDKDSRDKILGILLHPHTRSFKVRAAIGKRDWKNLSTELQMKPLDREVPNVLGTYHLEGERRYDAATLEKNGRYCGRGIRYNSGHDLWEQSYGVRARLLMYLHIIEAIQRKREQAETTSKVPTQERD
ncbi:hypothetical protein K469DRAFT_694852 [Zopfia rhizophila CBS 207.26]|uniref:Uncharacterized protein n=1 Tax=Zopfia rhizophila CBS 207.26 TaxID=1314779 RepID=A0A6A6EMM1_9PEZI|nr:hypothetical protein K469DRAFT_694852 [Zopfia rhizophila CBS 207.26]